MAKSTPILIIAAICWALTIGVGMFILMKYDFTPGQASRFSGCWPQKADIKLSGSKSTLVMFIHPLCPCSKASVSEFAHLMLSLKVKPKAYVFLVEPKWASPEWANSDLVVKLQSIEGTEILHDVDGREADIFDAKTSGQIFIYDARGELMYKGGITAARGHEGDNCGLRSAKLALTVSPGHLHDEQVFGCSLVNAVRNNK